MDLVSLLTLPPQDLKIMRGVITTRGQAPFPPDFPYPYCGLQLNGSGDEILGFRHLASYFPFVGDVVQVLMTGPTDGFVLGKLEDNDASWPGLALASGWTGFVTPPFATPRFSRDGIRVQVKGLVWYNGGVANPIATMDVNFRPSTQIPILCIAGPGNGTPARVDVQTDGQLIYSAMAGNNVTNTGYLSLDQITYLVG